MRSHGLTLGFLLTLAAFHADGALAAGPDVCAALPIAVVNELVHQNLSGVRSDVSEEAHSYAGGQSRLRQAVGNDRADWRYRYWRVLALRSKL